MNERPSITILTADVDAALAKANQGKRLWYRIRNGRVWHLVQFAWTRTGLQIASPTYCHQWNVLNDYTDPTRDPGRRCKRCERWLHKRQAGTARTP